MPAPSKPEPQTLRPEESAPPLPVREASGKELHEGDLINNRYRVSHKLGHGGMGTVYLVADNWRGDRQLALKRVRKDRLDDRTITILRNEFLALSPLTHPNLARVHDFEVDLATGDFFFTSEYVDGVQLLRAARDFKVGRPADFQRFLVVLAQICRALEYIHTRGLVHGDIKPENILISGSLSEPSAGKEEGPPLVKMIDFGLTKREKEFGGKRIVGTAYYIAPETILGSQVDRRTDLYSLGVVLYHITTRKLPFTGNSNLHVLRGHIEKQPTPPNLVEPSVPETLGAMILKLMEKQPTNRYASALELIEAMNAAFGTAFPLETPETRLSYVRSGGFIARETEMGELATLFEKVYRIDRQTESEAEDELNLPLATLGGFSAMVVGDRPPPPSGRMALIRGEPGVGKRRLLKEFRRYVQTRGVHYLEIDCGQSADGARRSFAELVHAQVKVLSAMFPDEAPDQERLDAFLESIEKAAVAPLAMRPAVEKLARKFLKLSRAAPVVLAFIEVQKADMVLLEFLRALVIGIAGERVPDSQVMIVATADDDDPEESLLRPFLAAGNLRSHIRELPLSRFSAEEVGRQVTSMFGESGLEGRVKIPERIIHLVYEESDGNPGVVEEIVQCLVTGDRIRRSSSGWQCAETIEREAIPGKRRGELRERIGKLEPVTHRLARALALAGGGELEVAARLAELPPGKIINAVLALKRARIIREDPADASRYAFVHSSAREILYDEIPAADRQGLHDRAGHLLEAYLKTAGKTDPRRLAYHFLRAGNAASALRYGADAAREYAALHLPRKAIEVYGEMRRFAVAEGSSLAHDIDRAVARLHFQMGEYRAAAEVLKGLLGVLPEAQRAGVYIELGEVHCSMGSFREGAGTFQEAFRLLKGGGANPELAALLLGFADLYYKKGNHAESLRYCDRVLKWEKGLGRIDLETRLYLLLADNHFRLENKEIAARYCQKGLELLGAHKSTEHLALTLLYLGKFHTYKGRFQKALRNLEQCALVNQKIGSLDRQADCLREIGGIFLLLDRPREALSQLSHAAALFERTENLAACAETLNLRAEALRVMGHYQDAEKDLQQATRWNTSIGSMQSTTGTLHTLARVALDHGQDQQAERYLVEADRAREAQAEDRVPLQDLILRLEVALRRGDFAEALDLAARGIIAGREIGNRLRTAPLLNLLVRLYLALGRHGDARRSLISLAEIGQRYGLKVIDGRSSLLEGMLLCAEGRNEEAVKAFESSMAVFREERSERDLIELYIELGRLQLVQKNHEQAYILFEESLYLAKKLNLAYPKCRLFHLMGALEASNPEGVFAKAVGYFISGERYARTAPFADLLWRIRRDLGKFYLEAGRVPHAERTLTQAVEARRELLEKMPEGFRDGYLAAVGVDDLDTLHVEAKARSEVQSRREQAKYPPRNTEENEYFGLVGRSAPMRELYRVISRFPPEEPWVWVWGPPGSGRREVARAIHRQSVPGRERTWTVAGGALKRADLDRILGELERARSSIRIDAKPGGQPGQLLTIPGRFTLIIADAAATAPEVQTAVLELALAERSRCDGLRVVATLDREPESCRAGAAAPGAAGGGGLQPSLLVKRLPAVRVPPLSERLDDIPLLVKHFLVGSHKGRETSGPRLSPEALEAVRAHPFEGQVKEVEELCEKLRRLVNTGGVITLDAARTVLTPLKANRRA